MDKQIHRDIGIDACMNQHVLSYIAHLLNGLQICHAWNGQANRGWQTNQVGQQRSCFFLPEDISYMSLFYIESPPRMRGIEGGGKNGEPREGITPAHAGNSRVLYTERYL